MSLGRGAVDFVGQQNLGENGAFFEIKLSAGDVEDTGPQNIRGHQVWRELDTGELGLNEMSQRLGHECFGGAGHPLEQDVSSG